MISRVSGLTPVNFSAKKRVSFGDTAFECVNKEPESFYGLSDSSKLNVIFNLLVSARANQENAYETITQNQREMHRSNQHAFMSIANDGKKQAFIYDTFERNRVGQIPAMPVFTEAQTNSQES